MEVKVRLGPTQRTTSVALYPPPTLAKFTTDCIKLFKLPTDTPLNITYKTDRNQQITVNTDGDFNDALKAREKAKPSFQIAITTGEKKQTSSKNLTSMPAKSGSSSSVGSQKNLTKGIIDLHKKKKEPAAPSGPVAGDNPLHEAVRSISHSKVVELSTQTPSYRTEVNASGLTPLHLAAQLGHAEVVALLLSSGCLIDEVDMQQNTPIHQAAVCGHLPMYIPLPPFAFSHLECRSLMQGGANLLLANATGNTVLHLLMGAEVAHEEKPLYRILINDVIRSFRFNMNARNTAGATALHIAASRGFRWNMKVLLMHNPDINAQSKNGDTALHLAARQGDKKMAQRLLDKGADVEILNEEKQNALQTAQHYKHTAVIEVLAPLVKPPPASTAVRPPSEVRPEGGLSGTLAAHTAVAASLTSHPSPPSPARTPGAVQPSSISAPTRSAPAAWAPARAVTGTPTASPTSSLPGTPAPGSPAVAQASSPAVDKYANDDRASSNSGRTRPHRRDSSADQTKKDKPEKPVRQSSKLQKEKDPLSAPPSPAPASPSVPPLSSTPNLPPSVAAMPSPITSPHGSNIAPLRDSPNSPNFVITREMIQGDGMEAMAQLLRMLGLAQWIDKFKQEDIDLSTARELQDDTLQILGLPVGSRLRLIRAVRNIYEPQSAELTLSSSYTTPRKPAAPVVVANPLDPALEALLKHSDLSQYAEVFRLEELTLSAVRRLNDTQLKELGLTMGARIRLLDALSKLK